ncbi:hypothetical protein LSPH24S_05475 [Lysinibacillus sphaericus]
MNEVIFAKDIMLEQDVKKYFEIMLESAIIINDGSTDNTLQTVIKHFQMKPVNKIIKTNIHTKQVIQIYESEIYMNCILVDKVNGGKADALNVGINVSQYPYFCSIDGDSILDEKALLRVMKPIVLSDGEVIAAGGNIRIAKRSENATWLDL